MDASRTNYNYCCNNKAQRLVIKGHFIKAESARAPAVNTLLADFMDVQPCTESVGACGCSSVQPPHNTWNHTPRSLSLEPLSARGEVRRASSRHDGAHRVIGSERRLALWITMHFKYDSPILTAAKLIISLPAPCDPPPARLKLTIAPPSSRKFGWSKNLSAAFSADARKIRSLF
jgi:hypothetical protein